MRSLYIIILVLFTLISIPLVFSQTQVPCTRDQDCLENGLLNHFCNTTTGFCQPRQDAQPSPGNYIVVPSTEAPEPTTTQSPVIVPTEQGCIDSDGGKNYYEQGSVKVILGENYYIGYPDFCLDKNILKEYYCKDSKMNYENYDCSKEGKICIDSRCSSSTDIDEEDKKKNEKKFYILDKTELDFPDINYKQTVDGIYTGVDPYVYKFRNIVKYTDTKFYPDLNKYRIGSYDPTKSNPVSFPDSYEWRKITIYDPIMVYFYIFHSDKNAKIQAQYGLEIKPINGTPFFIQLSNGGQLVRSSYLADDAHKIPCEFHEEKEDGNIWKCKATLELSKSLEARELRGSVIRSLITVTDDSGNELREKSGHLVVAKWLFSVITENGDLGSTKKFMDKFVDISSSQNGLVKSYEDSLQHPQASYKIVYYKDTISVFTYPDFHDYFEMPETFIHVTGNKDVAVIFSDTLLENYNKKSNRGAVGLADVYGSEISVSETTIQDETIAHEIGHIFGLCDEYSISIYMNNHVYPANLDRETAARVRVLLSKLYNGNETEKQKILSEIKSIVKNLRGYCPNPFPPCCEAGSKPSCGSLDNCYGMPKGYPPSVRPPYSVMGTGYQRDWYPQGSVCPLKDCG